MQQEPKPPAEPERAVRRTRGKVLPPKVQQPVEYWEDLFQRCLDEYERASGNRQVVHESQTEPETDAR